MRSGAKTCTIALSAVGMGILILDSRTALAGAAEGLELCIRTIIPSLFPFFFLSVLLTGNISGNFCSFLRPLGKLCGIPQGAESLLLVGFLGGYPTGAQTISQAWKARRISKADAQRMLAFCNNAGPAFLFGIGSALFDNHALLWILWFSQILSALLTAICIPIPASHCAFLSGSEGVTPTKALERAAKGMASVCGWVLVFRVIRSFLIRWVIWVLPYHVQAIVSGLLELSGGCMDLYSLEDSNFRYMLFSTFLCCGGVCVALQTFSVTEGLRKNLYFCGKVLQTGFNMMLNFIICCSMDLSIHPQWLAAGMILIVLSLAYIHTEKNNSRNLEPTVV